MAMRSFIRSAAVCISFLVCISGCHSTRQFVVEDRLRITDSQKIYKVETTDGKVIRFDSDPLGYAILRGTNIVRSKRDGTLELIPLSTVKIIHTREPDTFATIFCIALGIGGIVMLVLSGLSRMKVG